MVGAVAGVSRWHARGQGFKSPQLHPRSTAISRLDFRRTEREVRVPGTQPKSVFQLVGAGQVGRGSLYGMQALHRLTGAGFRIWPFDPPALPLAVEIYPGSSPAQCGRQPE
jgi:hypothetical protein